jgi:hypothetical protein
MYHILLNEVITADFMHNTELVNTLQKQQSDTLNALFPAGVLDPIMRYYFETACVVEELYCKPLRVLACSPTMTPDEFQKTCTAWMDAMKPLLSDNSGSSELRGEKWQEGQKMVASRLDESITQAVSNKRKREGAAGDQHIPDNPRFRAGQYEERQGERLEWPGSGKRELIFKKTLQGISDALCRNIVSLSQKAAEMSHWTDAHVQTMALNHTLIVESVFAHMRNLETKSKVTRGPLMEAVIMCKLDPTNLFNPPPFLPRHITTPNAIRHEGREAQAGYGSRRKRGAALLAKAVELATQARDKREKRDTTRAAKVQSAQDSGGGMVYERGDDNEHRLRSLVAGERLKWEHFLEMGAHLDEWLTAFTSNDTRLKWSDRFIQNQLLLINSEEKSRALIVQLKQVSCFSSRGKSLFALRREDGSRMIPTTTGNRGQKVLRLVQYIMAEQRAVDGDTGISEFWRAATHEEVQADLLSRVSVGARREGSKAASGTRNVTAETDGALEKAVESGHENASEDLNLANLLFQATEGGRLDLAVQMETSSHSIFESVRKGRNTSKGKERAS